MAHMGLLKESSMPVHSLYAEWISRLPVQHEEEKRETEGKQKE